MPEFLPEELNLIYLYDPGNLHGLIYELRSMMAVLMPDENELRNLTQGVIIKNYARPVHPKLRFCILISDWNRN